MIRRDHRFPDGSACWALISQMEHAHLAGDLAAAWGAGPFHPPSPRAEVVAAVYHHDDGWAAWEEKPEIDAQTGRPYTFTEMPQGQSLTIWQRSIDAATRIGNLAAWMVAGHFSVLLRSSEHGTSEAARRWLAHYDTQRAQWLAAWEEGCRTDRSRALADRALAQLQLFDAISLWLCCAERSEPQSFTTPEGSSLLLAPREAGQFLVSPWPFHTPALEVEVSARAVPAVPWTDAEALAAAPSRPVIFLWQLIPS